MPGTAPASIVTVKIGKGPSVLPPVMLCPRKFTTNGVSSRVKVTGKPLKLSPDIVAVGGATLVKLPMNVRTLPTVPTWFGLVLWEAS